MFNKYERQLRIETVFKGNYLETGLTLIRDYMWLTFTFTSSDEGPIAHSREENLNFTIVDLKLALEGICRDEERLSMIKVKTKM